MSENDIVSAMSKLGWVYSGVMDGDIVFDGYDADGIPYVKVFGDWPEVAEYVFSHGIR